MTDAAPTKTATRPDFVHLIPIQRVLVWRPDFLDADVTVAEKVRGASVRAGRDDRGEMWRARRSGLYTEKELDGFDEFVRTRLGYLSPGVTLYGKWVAPERRLYAFAERVGTAPFESRQSALDRHMFEGVHTVPVIHEGRVSLDVLEQLLRGPGIVRPDEPIPGLVVTPIDPVYEPGGEQVVAKLER